MRALELTRLLPLLLLLQACDSAGGDSDPAVLSDASLRLDGAPAPADGQPPLPTDDLGVAADLGAPDATAPPDDGDTPPPDADLPTPDADVPPPASCAAWGGLSNAALVSALHEAVQAPYSPIAPEPDLGGNPNRYTTARHLMFTQVDRFVGEGGAEGVECLYTGRFVATGPDEEPDDDDINAEHVWPRSRMNPDRESALYWHQQSDIHILHPSDSGANSARGSLRYGEPVSDRDLDYLPAVVGLDGSGDRVFQPRAESQGDVARATFYFSVRWGLPVSDAEEEVLRRWSAADPPDARERGRNDRVEATQGNRNPFVDCPELVERVADFAEFPIRDGALPLP